MVSSLEIEKGFVRYRRHRRRRREPKMGDYYCCAPTHRAQAAPPHISAEGQGPIASEQLRKVFKGKIIAAGGFEPDMAKTVVEKSDADLVAFGVTSSRTDLPKRIKLALPLNPYVRNTFYNFDARGYIDYPFYEGFATTNFDSE